MFGNIDHHDKQGDGARHQHEEPDIPRRLRPHEFCRTMIVQLVEHIECREAETDK
jgi:hypothetical protein